jgi:hypothetical protein
MAGSSGRRVVHCPNMSSSDSQIRVSRLTLDIDAGEHLRVEAQGDRGHARVVIRR